MRRSLRLLLAILTSICSACGSPVPGTDSGADVNPTDSSMDAGGTTDTGLPEDVVADGSVTDAPIGGDASTTDTMGTDGAADATSDGAIGACGTDRPALTGISGTEGLVIGPDGTIYYSTRGGVGRLRPGMAPENRWVSVGGTTIWGLALDVPNHQLFVGSPDLMEIAVIDLSAATPSARVVVSGAGAPNGLTIGPDGLLYYTDFNAGTVYRVDGTGMRTAVTTSTIRGANGLAFAADGTLYVDGYAAGVLWQLTLSAGREASRRMVATGLGSPDGLAFDRSGRIYVTDNRGGTLMRLNADGTGRMDLLTGIGSAANIEFGAGSLNCNDIYVATGGGISRYTMGTTPGADVPWHH